jgi:hypothetical protein
MSPSLPDVNKKHILLQKIGDTLSALSVYLKVEFQKKSEKVAKSLLQVEFCKSKKVQES